MNSSRKIWKTRCNLTLRIVTPELDVFGDQPSQWRKATERRIRERAGIDGNIPHVTKRGMTELAGLTSSFLLLRRTWTYYVGKWALFIIMGESGAQRTAFGARGWWDWIQGRKEVIFEQTLAKRWGLFLNPSQVKTW